MKYLVILIILLLTGCLFDDSAESYGIVIGQELYVDKGFYKGCTGIVTSYDDYRSIDDMVTLDDVQCIDVKTRNIRVEAKNLKIK